MSVLWRPTQDVMDWPVYSLSPPRTKSWPKDSSRKQKGFAGCYGVASFLLLSLLFGPDTGSWVLRTTRTLSRECGRPRTRARARFLPSIPHEQLLLSGSSTSPGRLCPYTGGSWLGLSSWLWIWFRLRPVALALALSGLGLAHPTPT